MNVTLLTRLTAEKSENIGDEGIRTETAGTTVYSRPIWKPTKNTATKRTMATICEYHVTVVKDTFTFFNVLFSATYVLIFVSYRSDELIRFDQQGR